MYLSLRWVEKFVKLPALTAEELALKVTMSTVEVESVIKQSQSLEGIVIGQIKELVKHPQADRLSICKTTIGSQTLQIICGGTNLREGMTVAVAKVGARVRWHGEGELVTLEPAKIRGQESNGMIVASSEIGLEKLFPAASDHEIIDLSDYNFKPGASRRVGRRTAAEWWVWQVRQGSEWGSWGVLLSPGWGSSMRAGR
jgi:phenylalanyl-tRNA synthetase beta chain